MSALDWSAAKEDWERLLERGRDELGNPTDAPTVPFWAGFMVKAVWDMANMGPKGRPPKTNFGAKYPIAATTPPGRCCMFDGIGEYTI